MKKSKKLYINKKQAQILQARQKTKAAVAGRGGGKTNNIGDHIRMYVDEMPRSKGFLLLKNFGMAYTKSLPEILDRLSSYDFKEHKDNQSPGHYVVCKTPPSWYEKPYKVPRKYNNTVTFYNGTMMDILSFDRPDSVRGGSYDWGIVDEAALINYDMYTITVRPLLRGNTKQWTHPLRFSLIIYTSRAWKKSGKWVEETMKRLAAEDPDNYFYTEFSAMDNMDVLGEEYFERMKKEFNPIKYAVEILNQPIASLPDGYYEYLDEETHAYDPEYQYDYDEVAEHHQIISEKDVHTDVSLDVSLDFNAAFTSATIWQDLREKEINELRCVHNFFVKHTSVVHLVNKICDHYRNHPTQIINIYGGGDGHHRREVISEYTYFEIVANQFRARGWQPNILAQYKYSDMGHKIKYEIMSAVMMENDPELPVMRINSETAKETIISMMNTQILGDYKKDKSAEKDDTIQQEFAPHLSDTVDNYVIPKVKMKALRTATDLPAAGAWGN